MIMTEMQRFRLQKLPIFLIIILYHKNNRIKNGQPIGIENKRYRDYLCIIMNLNTKKERAQKNT
jgi:hypothetical protein